jgi:hypothetical protein
MSMDEDQERAQAEAEAEAEANEVSEQTPEVHAGEAEGAPALAIEPTQDEQDEKRRLEHESTMDTYLSDLRHVNERLIRTKQDKKDADDDFNADIKRYDKEIGELLYKMRQEESRYAGYMTPSPGALPFDAPQPPEATPDPSQSEPKAMNAGDIHVLASRSDELLDCLGDQSFQEIQRAFQITDDGAFGPVCVTEACNSTGDSPVPAYRGYWLIHAEASEEVKADPSYGVHHGLKVVFHGQAHVLVGPEFSIIPDLDPPQDSDCQDTVQ